VNVFDVTQLRDGNRILGAAATTQAIGPRFVNKKDHLSIQEVLAKE
jgi:hypothetical protein